MYSLFHAVPAVALKLVSNKVYIEMAVVAGPHFPKWNSREMLGFGGGVNIGSVCSFSKSRGRAE